MASTELLILSSSPRSPAEFPITPPGAQQQTLLTLSSSPGLPSPSALLRHKSNGALQSGSRAAQIPQGATTGFATAASLVKDRRLSLSGLDEGYAEYPRAASKQNANLNTEDESLGKKPDRRVPKADASTTDGKAKAKKPKARKGADAAPSRNVEDFEQRNEGVPILDAVHPNGLATNETAQEETLKLVTPVKRRKLTKPRKEKGEAQTKISRAKITKPQGDASEGKRAAVRKGVPSRTKATDTASEHFAGITPTEDVSKAGHAVNIDSDLGLEAAHRRTRWTPPRESDDTILQRVDAYTASQAWKTSDATSRSTFPNLLVDFGYGNPHLEADTAPRVRSTSGEAPTKRRRIQPLEVPTLQVAAPITTAPTPDAAPTKKGKSPKKKARTITDLATAQFKPPADPATLTTTTVSAFFAPRTNSAHSGISVSAHDKDSAEPNAKTARRQKSPTKEGPKAKKNAPKKKPTFAVPRLLSPAAALKKMNGQDILFGSSSQLAREESPTFIQDLQQAMRESEAACTIDDGVDSSSTDATNFSTSLAHVKPGKGIWSAAARNFDGGLFRTRMAKLPGGGHEPVSADSAAPSEPPQRDDANNKVFEDVDDIVQAPAAQAPAAQAMHTTEEEWTTIDECPTDETPHDICNGNSKSTDRIPNGEAANPVPAASTEQITTLTAPTALACSQNRVKSPAVSALGNMRNERVALQQLTSNANISSRHSISTDASKPSRNVKALSIHATTPLSDQENSRLTASEVVISPVKSPRGRPRKAPSTDTSSIAAMKVTRAGKTTTATAPPTTPKKLKRPRRDEWTNIDEIEDSEPEISPSPPRRMDSLPSSQTLELASTDPIVSTKAPTTSSSTINRSSHPDWPTTAAQLFPRITATVKAAPPTTDAKKPSWHEKMLLYDPIVLEDLTAWLNERGLRVPGRKREGKEFVETCDELRPWMVQKWCEEMSVCCLWKEGLRGGVRTRY